MRPAFPSFRADALIAAALLLIFARMLGVALLSEPSQAVLLMEGGMIESASALGYGVCIALLFWLWPADMVRRRFYFPVLLAVFAARELDLDKIPFTKGLFKSSQYLGDGVPLTEVIVSGLLLAAIIATVLMLLLRETGPFVSGLRRRDRASIATAAGIAFIFFYKAIDGLARKLEPFGIRISDALNRNLSVIEEVGELGIPVMFAIAILLAAQKYAGAQF